MRTGVAEDHGWNVADAAVLARQCSQGARSPTLRHFAGLTGAGVVSAARQQTAAARQQTAAARLSAGMRA